MQTAMPSHTQVARAHRPISPLSAKDKERFWAKVDVRGPDECWEWTASKFPQGYGYFRFGSHRFGAHRIAWTIANGPIPTGFLVCHKCDNRACCNPNHLFAGSHTDNMTDAAQKGRLAFGERNGSAKVTRQDVCDIRRRAANGESQRALAREYGVSHGTTWFIVNSKTWKHVF